jgi:hypothetical protein
MLEVVGTQCQIGTYIGYKGWTIFANPHFFRYPFCGARHQLHQAHCARAGSGIAYETAFLTDESVYPGFVKLLLFHDITQRIAMRREETQAEIMILYRFFRGIDGAVVDSMAPGNFSGGQ